MILCLVKRAAVIWEKANAMVDSFVGFCKDKANSPDIALDGLGHD